MTDSPIRPSIGLAPNDTVEFFRTKGEYLTREKWWETWQEEHTRAFTVAGIMDTKVLESVRGTLDDMLANGGTFEMWKAKTLPALRDAVKNGTAPENILSDARLRTIYSTNLRMARAAGQWKRIQAFKANVPFLKYIAVHDGHTRPQHRIWGGVDNGKPIILPVDHPAWDYIFPPNGWGCRCQVVQLSQHDIDFYGNTVTTDAELAAMGLPTSANIGGNLTGVKTTDYIRGDGALERVVTGIDPGFAYNVGQHHMRGLVPIPLEGQIIERVIAKTEQPAFVLSRTASVEKLEPLNVEPIPALQRWREIADYNAGGFAVITDPTGTPIIIDDNFWIGADGQLKITKRNRQQLLWFIAETLKDPDEIWTSWELDNPAKRKSNVPQPSQLIRRMLARFVIDGEEKNVTVILEIGPKGWIGKTSFGPTDAALEKRRFGVLEYRRK